MLGLGRSGTTVISEYLAHRSHGWCLGEVVNVFEYGLHRNELCQCGNPFHDCPFWTAIGQLAFGGWQAVSGHASYEVLRRIDTLPLAVRGAVRLLTASERRQVATYSALHLAICRAASALTGVTTILDSSKHPATALWLAQSVPQLKTLHVVRDSRAVAWSWGKRVARPESGGAQTFMDRFDVRTSAELWNRTNLVSEIVQRASGVTARIRYEDFCADPEASARQAMRALLYRSEGDLESRTSKGYRFEHSVHAIGGNPMRFRPETQHVRLDAEWRLSMPQGTIEAVTRRTIILLVRYRYVSKNAATRHLVIRSKIHV